MPVNSARLHDLLELGGNTLFKELAPAPSGHGDDDVPVADGGHAVRGLVQRIAYLRREIRELPNGRVLLKNDLPVLVRKNLQRVALADAHGAADLFGDDYAAQVVPLCQVGAKKFYKLSEKPLISMALGFPDGATMRLRGFDRLCYFRSKFDRFATK